MDFASKFFCILLSFSLFTRLLSMKALYLYKCLLSTCKCLMYDKELWDNSFSRKILVKKINLLRQLRELTENQ